jgi:hypothetical protein
VPPFVLLVVALLVVLGALALWVELLIRSAAVYVAVLFLPLALGSLVWPAISHWCRRVVDALAALILSKFVIVAILSLAVGALASGTGSGSSSATGGGGVSTVLAGAALLLLAAFSPYTLLRLVPLAEAGAISHLEGLRHRAQHVGTSVPRDAANFALRQARLASFDTGVPGTGLAEGYGAAGGDDPGPSTGSFAGGTTVPAGGEATAPDDDPADGSMWAPPFDGMGSETPMRPGGPASAIPMWRGDPASAAAFDAVMSGRVTPPDPAPSGPPVLQPQPSSSAEARTTPDRGRHVIARDAMGPVIRWIPPGSDDG